MIKTSQPALHGNQHLLDGSDPIPGLLVGGGFGSYADVLRATGGLVGYWKLDDPLDFAGTFTPTADFGDAISLEMQTDVVADSSGLDNHLSYYRQDTDTPRQDITLVDGYADLPGSPSPQAFEWAAGQASHAVCMRTAAWTGLSTPVKSVSFWFNSQAAGTPAGWMLGTHEVDTGANLNKGWTATLGYTTFPGSGPSGTAGRIEIWHSTGATSPTSPVLALVGPAIANNTWYHLAITSDGTTNTLYLNGVAVDTFTTVGNILETYQTKLKLGLQGYKSGLSHLGLFANAVILDEVAIWTETVSEYYVGLQAGLGGTSPGAVYIPSALVDAKGDLIAASGDDIPARLPVGTNGQVLTADSTAATGISWQAGGGAPTGSAGGALDGTYPNPGIAASVAGAGLSEASNVLAVNVDASTIEIASDTLRVKADGITANEIAAGQVGASELASTAVGAGSYGDATHVAQFTVDADGRLTAASSVAITSSGASPTDTKAWLPLTTTAAGPGDDVLVFDDDHSLIPTLVSF